MSEVSTIFRNTPACNMVVFGLCCGVGRGDFLFEVGIELRHVSSFSTILE